MCSLRFENNLLTIKGVRFASISKKTPLSKLSFAFVSLALLLLNIYIYILLGLPVFAKRSQTWTGLLNAERVNRKSKVYSRVEQFTRPTECPTQPRKMIDANRVYTFILQRNAYKLGATLRLSFEQRTGLVLADFLEALRTVRQNKARHNNDAILISKARYCSLLSRCWNGKNPWVSITHIDSLQQDSRCLYLHMNLNRNLTMISESRKVKPI
jgi:hypothetical protein